MDGKGGRHDDLYDSTQYRIGQPRSASLGHGNHHPKVKLNQSTRLRPPSLSIRSPSGGASPDTAVRDVPYRRGFAPAWPCVPDPWFFSAGDFFAAGAASVGVGSVWCREPSPSSWVVTSSVSPRLESFFSEAGVVLVRADLNNIPNLKLRELR